MRNYRTHKKITKIKEKIAKLKYSKDQKMEKSFFYNPKRVIYANCG